jgi:hypothetical protein
MAALAPFAPSPESRVWWRVITRRDSAETLAEVPPAWFRLDPKAAPVPPPPELKAGPDGQLIVHALRGADAPAFGQVKRPVPVTIEAGAQS